MIFLFDIKFDSFVTMLREGLLKLGFSGDDRILVLLNKYMDEIELFNTAYGLVKVKDRDELIVKHILDSLAPVNIIHELLADSAGQAAEKKKSVIADVGSGAGLPGIPLAICMSNAEFTLIERMGRRAGFLSNVQALLGLTNVKIEEAEMEKAAGGRFDLIVFRAFRPLTPPILKGLLKLLAPRGILAAYKGRRESIEEEMAAMGRDGNLQWEIVPLEVPFLEEERHLVLIRP